MKVGLSPTQIKFVKSEAVIVGLIGPMGEGKTFGGTMAMLKHALRCEGTMRGAIIRDTFENIRRMTIPSIRDALAIDDTIAKKFTWRDRGRRLVGPGIDIDLMGIDDLGSLSKLQGAEYSFIWLEEPAPIAERANAGLPEEVFDVALSRVSRQKGGVPRLQVTMNPADEEHWTYKKLVDAPINPVELDYLTFPDLSLVTTEVMNIPYLENQHLTDVNRQTVIAAYKDRPELYQRYVEGRFAYIPVGESVTPEYNEEFHRSKVIIDPIEKCKVWRMWDGGLNPTCVFVQFTPGGRVVVLDTVRGENIGMRQLIKTKVKPLLQTRYQRIEEWGDIGDPNLTSPEQSDSEQSAAGIIYDELGGYFEGGVASWQPRRESVREVLSRMIDGRPMFQVSYHEGMLHRSLRGGWHYKRTNTGEVLRDKPVKDIHSHPGDALSHGIAKLLPWKAPVLIDKAMRERTHRRACGYATNKRRQYRRYV
jgi:hypothetical protein